MNIKCNKYRKNNFISKIIFDDIKKSKNTSKVITRFAPEPNGYLHIGHAKSICLNFGMQKEYSRSFCYLRFDDTNPSKAEEKFITGAKEDIKWLGFEVKNRTFYTSDYFEILYKLSILLIKKNAAYVCNLSPEEIRCYRGTLNEKGRNSPYRNRSIKENLYLFGRMRSSEFKRNQCTLRAKIDMSSGNINLRDPILYRMNGIPHPKTKKMWNIYPMYDFAHSVSDAMENITHSLCTLEFQDHRPLYNWVIYHCEFRKKPQQIEFSRLNLTYTVTSKRKLQYLVQNQIVSYWDDPRMPTLKALRRRGVLAQSIRNLCNIIGISKQDSYIDISVLEKIIRSDLNILLPRRNAVLNPLKVYIHNIKKQEISVFNHPQNHRLGKRKINISNYIYIDKDDFSNKYIENNKKLMYLSRARLMNAYVIECYDIIRDYNGNPVLLKCRYFPETIGGKKPKYGINPKVTLHWVDVEKSISAEIRQYGLIFNCECPNINDNVKKTINKNSYIVNKDAKLEKSLINTKPESRFQFNRLGYFCTDRYDHSDTYFVFNKIVNLYAKYK